MWVQVGKTMINSEAVANMTEQEFIEQHKNIPNFDAKFAYNHVKEKAQVTPPTKDNGGTNKRTRKDKEADSKNANAGPGHGPANT